MPDFRQLMLDIKKKNFAPIYILMGEETYYIDKLVESLENSVVADEDKEFDQSILYGAESNAAMVMEAAGQYPMWSDLRLVILKEAQALSKAKSELDKIASYIANPNPKTILCIAFKGESLGAKSALLKEAKNNKSTVVFDSPKIKEWKLGEVIKDFCFSQGIKIEEKAVEVLIANVGSSLSNIFSEIEKLRISLPSEDKKITADLVSDHIGVSKEFNNFELVSALSRRDYFKTLYIFRHFEDNPKANPTVVSVGLIFNFFQKIVLASFNADKNDKALMELLQLKNPYGLREIREGLRNYSAAQAVEAIHAIRDFDTRSKGIASFQKEFPLFEELLLRLLTL